MVFSSSNAWRFLTYALITAASRIISMRHSPLTYAHHKLELDKKIK